MDHKRINKLIKKISRLNDSIAEDEEFSALEKEHLLGYIKKLYEEVEAEIPTEMVEEKPEEIVEAVEPEEIPTAEEEEEVVVEVEEEMEEVVSEEVAPVAADLEIDEGLASLFEESAGSELSDKLAARPIKELSKAMSINERIFTMNELFGGDKDAFDNMLVAIDGLGSFDEAKNVLIGSVADKYDWSSKKKNKKAAGFIKLVRRRFA